MALSSREGSGSFSSSVAQAKRAHHHDENPDRKLFLGVLAAFLFAGTSVTMNFVNKATLMVFGLPNTLLLLQMVFAVIILVPLREAKLLVFPGFRWEKAVTLLPVTVLYTANVGFSLLGLRSLNVPMYQALKRLNPVITLTAKSLMDRQLPAWQVALSVVMIVAGCVVASLGDLTFDLMGYTYALLSCLLQSCYLILVENSGTKKNTGTMELLYYNSLLSLPLIALIIVVSGEATRAAPLFWEGAGHHGTLPLAGLICFCSIAGLLLNFSLFWCTQLNSALTTTIVGIMKSMVTTFLGFFLLGGVKFHPLNILGIAMNLVGGMWYSLVKYKERGAKAGAMHHSPGATKPLSARTLEA